MYFHTVLHSLKMAEFHSRPSFLAFISGLYNPLGILVMAGIDILPIALFSRTCSECLPLLVNIVLSCLLPFLIIGRSIGLIAEVSFQKIEQPKGQI